MRISSQPRIAVLALVGGLGSQRPPPGFAAPPNPPNGQGAKVRVRAATPPIDCSLPANAQNLPRLQQQNGPNGGQGKHQFPGQGQNGNGQNGQGNNNQNGQGNSNNHSPSNGMGPSGGGSFNFSSHDRSQFHQRFNGINFGFFGIPDFSIRLGVTIPHSYGLKPVPRSIYRYYPQFRGYLFFRDAAWRHRDQSARGRTGSSRSSDRLPSSQAGKGPPIWAAFLLSAGLAGWSR